MRGRITRASSLLWTLTLIACAGTKALQLDESGLVIELDIYSGRPNPVWQLTASEVSDLQARLSDLHDTTAVMPDHLGYRGFILRSRSGHDIRVYAGAIFFENVIYADAHDAEGWLRAYASRKGQPLPR